MSEKVNRDRLGCPRHVRFTPGSDQMTDIPDRQLRANFRLVHRSKSEGEDILKEKETAK